MWDVFGEFKKMRKQMDSLFERFETTFPRLPSPKLPEVRQPLIDVLETEDKVIVAAELPGIDKDNIILTVEENKIEIKAQKKSEKKIKKKGFYKHERSYTGFHRMFTLPCTVDAAKAKSEYKQGVLRITIPKLKKKIKIKKKVEVA